MVNNLSENTNFNIYMAPSTMKILDGDALMDGGTTTIQFEMDAEIQSITMVYSLPDDGQERVIWTGNELFEYNKQLQTNSDEEKFILLKLKSTCVEEFGEPLITSYLSSAIHNPGKNEWFFALNFLRLAYKEREYIQ